VSDQPSPVFRPAGISYPHLPSADPSGSAAFYRQVFGWKIGDNPAHPSFEDGTGHVIGAWVSDRRAANDSGVLPYVYVDNVDEVLGRVTAAGGSIVKPRYDEGDLKVATFSDPFGTVMGVWQRAPTHARDAVENG
jgi:predicted enzyme related to lactoylglutathione lyase